jgi:hypothetical protein
MKIQGPLVIDISLYDDHLNTQELIDGGVVSVIVGLYKQRKNGVVQLNDNCRRLCDQVKASTLILQTYFYYYPENDAVAEANWYVDTIFNNAYPVAFAWLDAESHLVVMDPRLRSEKFRIFTAQVASRFPKVGVYTGKWFVEEYAPEMNLWMGKYPTWIAQYGKQPKSRVMMEWADLRNTWLPNYDIMIPTGAKDVVGHQFTGDIFMLPGVYSQYSNIPGWINKGRMPLDVSVFTPAFIQSLGGQVVPPPPPPPPAYTDYIVAVNAINVRSAPVSLPTTWVRYAYRGEVLHVLGNLTNGYVQLTDGTWAYQQYLTKV